MAVTEEPDSQTSPHEPALVALCSKAVNLTISISTHLSDYIESPEDHTHTAQAFYAKLHPLCDVLRQIQVGISDLSNTKVFVPYKLSQELSTKIQHAVRDLISTDFLVVKLITNARKKGFKKFVDGFRRASLDAELIMLADTMAQHRETLSTGWNAFSKVLSKADSNSSKHAAQVALIHEENELELLSQKVPVHHLGLTSPETTIASPALHSHQKLQPGHHVQHGSVGPTVPPKPGFPLDESFDREHDWINTEFSSTDQSWRLNSFSRSSSLRFNPSLSLPETLHRFLPDQQLGRISSGPATHKAVPNDISQPQNNLNLEQQLRGVPDGDPILSSLLSQAVRESDFTHVQLLLSHGAHVNRGDNLGSLPLSLAVATASTEMVKVLLEHGADAHLELTGSGMSPFALAARQNQKELVQLMINHGINISETLSNGDTPITVCISQGARTDIIELLLVSGVNANGKTRDGKTPLFEALSMRRPDVVRTLLHHGASPNLAGPKHPLWPATYLPEALKLLIDHGAKPQMASGSMELAASINNIQSVQILLDAGVSPNLKKDGIYTPLCSAIRDDRADIVTLLLKHGADPNLPASEYPAWKCITHNRLHYLPSLVAAGADLHNPPGIAEVAVSCNNKEALMYLLLNGVSVNVCSNDGKSPLTTAIRDDRIQLMEMLLAHGANVTLRGEDWPLCLAVRKPAMLKRLLEHVHNPNAVTKGIIELAVQADQLESIKLLVQAGISVEDRTGGVFSPLTSAIRENRKPIVRYLLDEANADVNSPGEHLPLVKAIRRCTDSNDTEVIEMLLERGADINLIYRGWNAIMQAIEKGDKKLINVLIQKGNGIDLQTVDLDSGQTVYDMIHDRGWSQGIELIMENRHQLRMVTDGSVSKH